MQGLGICLRNNQGSLGNIHGSSFPEELLHDKGHRSRGQIGPAIQSIQSIGILRPGLSRGWENCGSSRVGQVRCVGLITRASLIRLKNHVGEPRFSDRGIEKKTPKNCAIEHGFGGVKGGTVVSVTWALLPIRPIYASRTGGVGDSSLLVLTNRACCAEIGRAMSLSGSANRNLQRGMRGVYICYYVDMNGLFRSVLATEFFPVTVVNTNMHCLIDYAHLYLSCVNLKYMYFM